MNLECTVLKFERSLRQHSACDGLKTTPNVGDQLTDGVKVSGRGEDDTQDNGDQGSTIKTGNSKAEIPIAKGRSSLGKTNGGRRQK